jgi:RNA 3'-terminal phosphate cyclase (ATP)
VSSRDVLEIDGSEGEGGGQILRSSLALSLVTGRPFRLRRIRETRSRPGLQRQHLVAVTAAAAVGEAEVEGATFGSSALSFRPRALRGGDLRFAIGSAGSTTLVFQTVFPALLHAPEPSACVFEGGTHNPMAPPYDFLEKAFLPLVRRMGASVETRLERRGFHPGGGGRFVAEVRPGALRPLVLEERGEIEDRRARILLANLNPRIASREAETLRELLGADWRVETEIEQDGRGPGNAVLLEVVAEHVTEVFVAFGARGVPAETVAETVVKEAKDWLASDVPVGRHLADQLLLPLALAGSGSFRTLPPTLHARTHADVIRLFLPDVTIRFETDAAAATVSVTRRR